MAEGSAFGAELRRLREALGMSQATLASKTLSNKSTISRIESGERKGLPPGFALRADTVLGAGGALKALAASIKINSADVAAQPVVPVDDIQLLWSLGQVSSSSTAPDWRGAAATPCDSGLRALYEAQLTGLDALGRRCEPGDVDSLAITYVGLVLKRATTSPEAGGACLDVAVRMGLLTSWMRQEQGELGQAQQLAMTARTLAHQLESPVPAGLALIRGAEIELHQGRPNSALALAGEARRLGGDGIAPLVLLRQAQAFAMDSRDDDCSAALTKAEDLLATSSKTRATPGPWPTADALSAVRGWCAFDLTDYPQARTSLHAAHAAVPESDPRSRAILGARLARAHFLTRDLTQAEASAQDAVRTATSTRSASAWQELEKLENELRRRIGDPKAIELKRWITHEREHQRPGFDKPDV